MKKFAAVIVTVAATCYVSVKWIHPWTKYQSAKRSIDRQCMDAQHQMSLLSDDHLYFLLTHAVDRT
ncbi:hypothetical protein A3E76_01270 [Candidatus Saccharibacteria bacterium RIFCSPHIGHO2_12_FULL_44_22]|nr:MAG: hypothetical protein A3E76_01270 [Candidatus Saccharibacteria bacterium RIFCSPHIGHO2_12_FULL_44_22]